MNLNSDFRDRAQAIAWLSRCGEEWHPELGLPVQRAETREIALLSMFSTRWADANGLARHSLMGYLAKHHYSDYGGTWNNLVAQSQRLLESAVGARVSAAIDSGGWPEDLAKTPLPELTREVCASIGKQMADRITAKDWHGCLHAWLMGHAQLAAIEMTYRWRFRRAPVFFEKLLEVYEAGHLPCGWDGDLDDWPNGKLVAY